MTNANPQSEVPHLESVNQILHRCPYRQHSPECREFHLSMVIGEAKINALIAIKVKEALIDEVKYWVGTYEKILAQLKDAIDGKETTTQECVKNDMKVFQQRLEELQADGGADEGN